MNASGSRCEISGALTDIRLGAVVGGCGSRSLLGRVNGGRRHNGGRSRQARCGLRAETGMRCRQAGECDGVNQTFMTEGASGQREA